MPLHSIIKTREVQMPLHCTIKREVQVLHTTLYTYYTVCCVASPPLLVDLATRLDSGDG